MRINVDRCNPFAVVEQYVDIPINSNLRNNMRQSQGELIIVA